MRSSVRSGTIEHETLRPITAAKRSTRKGAVAAAAGRVFLTVRWDQRANRQAAQHSMMPNFADDPLHHPPAAINLTITQRQHQFRRHDHFPVRIRLERRNCVDATLPRREPLTAQPILNRACHRRCRNIRWQHEILVPDGVVRCDVAAAFQMMASESMRLVNDRMDSGSG